MKNQRSITFFFHQGKTNSQKVILALLMKQRKIKQRPPPPPPPQDSNWKAFKKHPRSHVHLSPSRMQHKKPAPYLPTNFHISKAFKFRNTQSGKTAVYEYTQITNPKEKGKKKKQTNTFPGNRPFYSSFPFRSTLETLPSTIITQ